MRILHINCNYLGTALHQLMIQHLEDLGINNQVYVPTYDANKSVIVPNNNVCVSECFKKNDRILFDYKQKKIIDDIQRKIDIRDFDCIHAYTLFTDGNCARILSEKYDIPYIVTVRNTDVNAFFKYMIHLRSRGVKIMIEAQKIIFLSRAYRDMVINKYVEETYRTLLMKKTQVIPNGIDNFWFENSGCGKINLKEYNNRIRVIYAGRIDTNKNIRSTQKAIDVLRSNGYDASLTVIGKVDDEKEYLKVKAHKFTNVLPAMPKEKLMEQYRMHDIFVMPSYYESFGLVYAEAISQGLPIIYTRGQGFDGWFEDGTVGYGVDATDYKEIAKKIILSRSIKYTDNKDIIDKFRWSNIARKYNEIYIDILHKYLRKI